MRKFLILLVVCLALVVSCDENGGGNSNNSNNSNNPIETTQTVIDKSVVRVELESAQKKVNFFLEDYNGLQTLTAVCYDKDGNQVPDATVNWEYKLTSDANFSQDRNVFSFDVNSLDLQGDFYVKASAAGSGSVSNRLNLTAKYEFTLASKNKLANCMSYSFAVPVDSSFEKNDDGKIKFSSMYEFDGNGEYINDRSKRFVLNNRLSFYAVNKNYLYVIQKDGAKLGDISFSVSFVNITETDVKFDRTDEGGFLIPLGDAEKEINETFYLKFKCGDKDERTVAIDVYSAKETLSSPIIAVADGQLDNGKVVLISADNIDNSVQEIPGGNKLRYKVYRSPVVDNGEGKTLFIDDNNDKFEKSKDVKNGHEIHLLYEGNYEIRSWIENGAGLVSPVETLEVTVPLIELSDDMVRVTDNTPLYPFVWPQTDAGLQQGKDISKDGPVYTVNVWNKGNKGTVYCEYSSVDDEGGSDFNKIAVAANNSTPVNLSRKGRYDFVAWKENMGDGSGLPYPGDNKEFGIKRSVEVYGAHEGNYLKTSMTSKWMDYTLYAKHILEPVNIPAGIVVYYAVYNEGKLFYSNAFRSGDEPFEFDCSSLTNYKCYAYNCAEDAKTPFSKIYGVDFQSYEIIEPYTTAGFKGKGIDWGGYVTDNVKLDLTISNAKLAGGDLYMWAWYIIKRYDRESRQWVEVVGEKEGTVGYQPEIKIQHRIGTWPEGEYEVVVYGRQSQNSIKKLRTSSITGLELKKPVLTVAPEIDTSDAVQTDPGVRKCVIRNVKDAAGEWCQLMISLNGSSNNIFTNLTDADGKYSGNNAEPGVYIFDICTEDDGKVGIEQHIHVTALPWGTTYQRQEPTEADGMVVLRQLPAPYADIRGKYVSHLFKDNDDYLKYAVKSPVGGVNLHYEIAEGHSSFMQMFKRGDIVAVANMKYGEEDIEVDGRYYMIRAWISKNGWISSPVKEWSSYYDFLGHWKEGYDSCNTESGNNYGSIPF